MDFVLDNIKRLRKKRGYSHENLAQELNISQAAYSKLEKNKTKLTVERMFKLAEILKVEVSELLDIMPTNQFNPNKKEKTTVYLQEAVNLYQENKEQNEKIFKLFEACLQDKERLIERLEKLIK